MAEALENAAAPTDGALLAAAQGGDADAFVQLVGRYQDSLYRLIFHMVSSEAEAQTLVARAIGNVAKGLATFRGASTPSRWLYQSAANVALMALRGKHQNPQVALEEVPFGSADHSVVVAWPGGDWAIKSDDAIPSSADAVVVEAVRSLPDKYRVVFLLHDVEGLSQGAVGEILGLSAPTVKNRLHRCRMFIRGALDQHLTGGAS